MAVAVRGRLLPALARAFARRDVVAVRVTARLLWPVAPLLYLPGVTQLVGGLVVLVGVALVQLDDRPAAVAPEAGATVEALPPMPSRV